MELELHPKQGRAWLSDQKVTLSCSGIQGGKSTVGSLWCTRQTSKGWGKGDFAIVAAPTYKILEQSTLPAFMKYNGHLGKYLSGARTFTYKSGLVVFIRTSTDPESAEGITNVRWVWLDEAGKCKYPFWINLEGRAARTNAPLFLTTTPYGMNWPYQHLIKPSQEGKRDDVQYNEWLSIENPSFPIAEYERQRQILDPRTFRRKYMGIHERMEGLVYEVPEGIVVPKQALPKGTRYYASVDWGFAEGHEFALLVRAITLDGFQYDVDSFKQSGLDPNQQIEACLAKEKIWNVEAFLCDPARPDMISMLNKQVSGKARGFHVGNDKYKQVIAGITAHTALIRGGKYRIFEGLPDLLDEYETYHWAETMDQKEPKDEPVGVDDHLMDCARMMTVGTMYVFIKEPPKPFVSRKVPHRDFFDPTKRSKKKRNWDSF